MLMGMRRMYVSRAKGVACGKGEDMSTLRVWWWVGNRGMRDGAMGRARGLICLQEKWP